MNPAQGQQVPGQPAAGAAGAQGQRPPGPPMYQPQNIRQLPTLSEDEKKKYEQGLRGLWTKANNAALTPQEQNAARQKIIEFSRMLMNKIHQRRTQMGPQQGQQGSPAQPSQPAPAAQQPAPPTPTQQNAATQPPAQGQPQTQTPVPAPTPAPPRPAANAGIKTENGAIATTNAQPAATAPRLKIPDHIMQHVAKMGFQAPPALVKKSAVEAAEWVENIKEKYGKALLTMEGAKAKVQQMDKIMQDRSQQGNPFNEEETKNYQVRKEMQLKMYNDAHKWADSLRKAQQAQAQQQQGNVQPAGQNGAAAGDGAQTGAGTPITQAGNQNTTAGNASSEAAKNMAAQQANRAPSANGTPTPQQQARPAPNAQAQQQRQMGKPEQPQPAPINTALAAAAGQQQSTATPTQVAAARVQTPQSQTPVAGAGPTRALSHSAAMSLANQRANNTPGAQAASTQQASSTGTPVSGVVNQNVMGSGAQPQGGHPHAHPSQQQATIQSKLPIPKQLPEKATALPTGVAVGGGVNTGRPTMSQGSGTLGGVMNQPAVPKVPAYSHEAEGDHVLSKKKLDELVRQVCGGSAEGQDANLLTPDVEESVLNMADSFVDNVLHAACRNSKERGAKVLEIRDIQLVLERTYNIRIPGYSSDELRTVRKVQPSAGWIAKMSAVQAAKVMPGKGE